MQKMKMVPTAFLDDPNAPVDLGVWGSSACARELCRVARGSHRRLTEGDNATSDWQQRLRAFRDFRSGAADNRSDCAEGHRQVARLSMRWRLKGPQRHGTSGVLRLVAL